MLDPILEGFFMGFVLSLLLGPTFFLIIETSIKHGVRAALFLDLGVLIADIIFIIIAYKFFKEIPALEKHERTLAFAGGVIFILFGAYTFAKGGTKKHHENEHPKTGKKYARNFFKGFVLTLVNFVLLFYWFGVMALGYTKNHYDDQQIFVYLACILVVFFGIDSVKIVGAGQLRKIVTPELLQKFNWVIGVIMTIFGLFMIVKGFGFLE